MADGSDSLAELRYQSLKDQGPDLSPCRGSSLPTTDLFSSNPNSYSLLVKGKEWIIVLLCCLTLMAFVLFFFVPRRVTMSPTQITMDAFDFNDRDQAMVTRIAAKISVSNPNFVALQVHSIKISLDYICKSCTDANTKTLGGQIVIVATSFPARTESATLPLALDFTASLPEEEFKTFRDAFLSNCTRDKIYFVSPKCSADVSYLGTKNHIELPTFRTRVPCESSTQYAK